MPGILRLQSLINDWGRTIAKEIILYDLKDNVSDDDYVKWCESLKGPVLLGLEYTRRFTLLRMLGGKTGDGQKGIMPHDAPSRYKYVGILDCSSLEGIQKDSETEAFQKGFFVEWMTKWVADFNVLVGTEVYDKLSD